MYLLFILYDIDATHAPLRIFQTYLVYVVVRGLNKSQAYEIKILWNREYGGVKTHLDMKALKSILSENTQNLEIGTNVFHLLLFREARFLWSVIRSYPGRY